MRGRKKFGYLPPAVCLFLASVLAGTAVAHRAYEGWTTVWSNGPNCVNEKVSLDHVSGSEGGLFWTEGSAQKAAAGINCVTDWVQTPNHFRIRTEVLKLTGGTWGLCNDTGYFKNVSDTAYMKETVNAGGSAPCGAGYYRTKGFTATLFSGLWGGGPIVISVNEKHWLPCAQGATCP